MLNPQVLVRLIVVAFAIPTAACALVAEAPISAKVQSQLTASWQGQELRTVLQRIADTQVISLWVDRRVDPQHIVNAQFNDAQLAQVLDQILDDADLAWSMWDEILYIGPRESARELATLMAIARQSLDKLSASRRAVWMTSATTSWPRLSDPREVLSGWLDQAGVNLKNPEVLNHDLWDARQLPPLPLVDRVILMLLGYDKTCQILASGNALEIVPINRPVLITKQYEPGRQMRELLAAFREDSAVVINRQGSHVAITGRWEDQERARQIIEGSTPNRSATRVNRGRTEERRFSLKLENQRVDKVIEQLAGQLGLAVNWQGVEPTQREKLASCEIQDVTLEDLLEAVLVPVGLKFSLHDTQLTISPGE